jgi:hypothetical protein
MPTRPLSLVALLLVAFHVIVQGKVIQNPCSHAQYSSTALLNWKVADQQSQRILVSSRLEGSTCADYKHPSLIELCASKKNCGKKYTLWYNDLYCDISAPKVAAELKNASKPAAGNPKVIISVQSSSNYEIGMFQHYFAQRIAQYLHSYMFAETSRNMLSVASTCSKRLQGMDSKLLWCQLAEDHPAKRTCRRSNVTYTHLQKNDLKTSHESPLLAFLDPSSSVECLIILGHSFPYSEVCPAAARMMWSGFVSGKVPQLPVTLGPRDMVVPLGCEPGPLVAIIIVLNICCLIVM